MEHDKCVINDSLALVLYIESLFGAAPLTFKRTGKGYKATVSRKIAIIGYIFIFISHVLIITLTVIKNYEKPLTEMPLGIFLIYIVSILASGVGSYSSYGRMKRILHYLNTLNKTQIYEKLNNKTEKQRKMLKTIIYLVANGLINTIDFIKLFLEPIDWISVGSFWLIHLDVWRIMLFLLEHILFQLDLLNALDITIGKVLLLETNDASSMSERPSREVSAMKSYLIICDIVEDINKNSGPYTFLLFANSILYLMLDMGRLIDILRHDNGMNLELFAYIMWVLLDISYAVLFVEPCHQINIKVLELQHLVTKVMSNITEVGKPISLELDLMSKQLLLNQPILSPMRIFITQRSILITMIGCISTYLAILMKCIGEQWV